MVNLDTHILIAVLTDSLTGRERTALEADPAWCIANIVLWELAMLAARKRIVLDLESRELREALSALNIFPVTLDLARVSCTLDFNADPADHLIVATSIVHDVPLMTRDVKIRRSKLVRLA
jgi:PIN domain nuclease of toxin-antitoxin system